MPTDRDGLAVVAEVVDVLQQHRSLRCTPAVLDDNGACRLVIAFHAGDSMDAALEILAVAHELQYVADMAQLRALADRYGVDPAALEPLLPDRDVMGSPLASSVVPKLNMAELEAMIFALENTAWVGHDHLVAIASALPKLRALLAGEIF